MHIKNIDEGPRGIFTEDGVVVLNPGETRDVKLSKAEAEGLAAEWFERVKPSKADPLDHDSDGRKGGSVPSEAKE